MPRTSNTRPRTVRPTHLSLDTLREAIRHADLADESTRHRLIPGKVVYRFDEFPEPGGFTPEEDALLRFIEALSHGERSELQALFWLGRDTYGKAKARREFECHLAHSAATMDEHVPLYLATKDGLGEALSNAIVQLELQA